MTAAGRRAFVAGTYWWNRPTVRALFPSPDGPPEFCWHLEDALARAEAADGVVVAWSSRLEAHHETQCAAAGVPLYRIEDGFVRSVGLGAGFVTAASLAVDGRGIYYDATRPSDLEHLMETAELDDAQTNEGAGIRAEILAARLTKYNLAGTGQPMDMPNDRPVVLVVGQVADDASILKTLSPDIDPAAEQNVNEQLLAQTRARHPDAFIIYKPHPDVVSNLRAGHVPDTVAVRFADAVVADANIIEVIERADRLVTISSLAGFEALLRGKQVTCYGMPFYAGWGLTEDLTTCPRRTRRRNLDEMVYIAFNQYTRHMHPYTRAECTIHELIEALRRQRSDRVHHVRNAVLKRAAWICERLKL